MTDDMIEFLNHCSREEFIDAYHTIKLIKKFRQQLGDSEPLNRREFDILVSKGKVPAMKEYRERTNVTLAESKRVIELYE